MEWNRATILHFISLIKERPAIWNAQSPEYKLKRKRHEAVEEVALLMGVSPNEVSTKWIILRNQYSREKRKITESAGGTTPYVTKWYAYKDMDTLMVRTKKLRPTINFWNQESKTDEDDSSNSPPLTPSRPLASGPQSQDTVTKNALSIYNQAIKTLKFIREKQNESNSDELTNYGLYIAAHLRKFSPPLQSKAKYEINKILYALDLQSMVDHSAAVPIVENDDNTLAKECKFDPLQNHKD